MPLVKAEPFEVMDVYKRSLGNFTDRDAKREGLKTLEQLKEWWINKYGAWNEEDTITLKPSRLHGLNALAIGQMMKSFRLYKFFTKEQLE